MDSATCRRTRVGRVESHRLDVSGKIGTRQRRRAESLSWVAGGWVRGSGLTLPSLGRGGEWGETTHGCHRTIAEKF